MGQIVVNSASAKHFYLVSEDILSIKPTDDGVRIVVKWRQQYVEDGRFDRVKFKFGQEMAVTFEGWQIAEAVEQIRVQEPGHCPECYDYGLMDAPPPECTRCLLLDACIRGGHGDHRKAKKSTIAPRRINWLLVSNVILFGLFWWSVIAQAEAQRRMQIAETRAQAAERDREALRREKHPATTFRRQAAAGAKVGAVKKGRKR